MAKTERPPTDIKTQRGRGPKPGFPTEHDKAQQVSDLLLGSVLHAQDPREAWFQAIEVIRHPLALRGVECQSLAMVLEMQYRTGEPMGLSEALAAARRIQYGEILDRLSSLRHMLVNGQLDGLPRKAIQAFTGHWDNQERIPDPSGSIDQLVTQSWVAGLPYGASSTERIEKLAQTVASDHHRQVFWMALNVAVDNSKRTDFDFSKTMTFLQAKADLGTQDEIPPSSIGEAVIEIAENPEPNIAPVGFLRKIDQFVPYTRGSVFVLAGPSSSGKTALAFQFAENCSFKTEQAPGATMFVSMEMSKADFGVRWIARHIPGIDTLRIARDGLTEEDRARINAHRPELTRNDAIVLHDNARSYTVEQIINLAKKHRRKYGRLELLVIDYLGLLKYSLSGRFVTEEQQIGHMTRTLKVATAEMNCLTLLLAQPSRSGKQEKQDRHGGNIGYAEPRITDLRGSGRIEDDADGVLLIWVPDTSEPEKLKIKIAKNRRGPKQTVNVYYDMKAQTFKNREDE